MNARLHWAVRHRWAKAWQSCVEAGIWENKKKLDHAISNTHVDKLYQVARKEGAIGGKMPGAGGGGYFLLLTRFDRKHRVAAALEKHGGQVVPFQFERRGMTAWASIGPEPKPARTRARPGRV